MASLFFFPPRSNGSSGTRDLKCFISLLFEKLDILVGTWYLLAVPISMVLNILSNSEPSGSIASLTVAPTTIKKKRLP